MDDIDSLKLALEAEKQYLLARAEKAEAEAVRVLTILERERTALDKALAQRDEAQRQLDAVYDSSIRRELDD